ncbi:MAG: STAS domain-containing protein [Lachnospiraceae bacterium]|nr:STAS domain-containing protein [Lachnospiraceae bacterium]
MKITKNIEGTKLNIALAGRLDTMTAPELEAAIAGDLANVSSAVLDLAELEYVSSAGLRVILSMHKELLKKEGLVVKNSNETVSEVFEVTGFSDILTIE